MNQSIREKWCEKEISDLDYIRHLEAENAKLKEPKTCEGCKYEGIDCTSIFRVCARRAYKDFYEPTEQQ